MVPSGGLEPPPRGARTRHAALTPRRDGANGGICTRTSRLGRPAGSCYPTFARTAWGGPVSLTGLPATPVGCQRSPLVASESTSLATAPGFEPGSASFGGSDAPVAPRCHLRSVTVTDRHECLRRRTFPVRRGIGPHPFDPNKKGLPGDRPGRPVSSMNTGPLGRADLHHATELVAAERLAPVAGAQAGGHRLDATQAGALRCGARRIEGRSRHLLPRGEKVRSMTAVVNGKTRANV